MRSLYFEQFIVTGSHMCVVCVHSHVCMYVIDAKLTCVYARRIYVALQQPEKKRFFFLQKAQNRQIERAKEGERVNKMETRRQ